MNEPVHIVNPSLCGPLRSLCGMRRPVPCVGTGAVLAHRDGRLVTFCEECWASYAGLFVQLSLFPQCTIRESDRANTCNDRPPVWDQVRTVVGVSDGDCSATDC